MAHTFITSGILKGNSIVVPSGIRPTQEKIRKAAFDITQQILDGATLLELFAGSGAIGFEAISRGVQEAVFVEENRQCCRVLEKNITALRAKLEASLRLENHKMTVLPKDALRAIDILGNQHKKFDLIFMDPPYYQDLAKKTLQKLSSHDIVSPHCCVIVEHSVKDILDESFGNLTRFKQKRYGDTVLSFYERVASRG